MTIPRRKTAVTITEDDCRLVTSLANTLKLELDPWQEYVLQLMFAEHRQIGPVLRLAP